MLCAQFSQLHSPLQSRASVLVMRKCRCARESRERKTRSSSRAISDNVENARESGERERDREKERERESASRDPLFVTAKDYLKNYLDGNGNASRSWAPFCARPIEALGGAYSIPREIGGVVNMDVGLHPAERNLAQLSRT